MDKRSRIYNTFDAHRLLHWAEEQGLQKALKHALFTAYFTDGQDLSNHEVLVRVASERGAGCGRGAALLAPTATPTRCEREQFYLQNGIHSVPAIIINERHLISGGSRWRCLSRPCDRLQRSLERFSKMIAAGAYR